MGEKNELNGRPVFPWSIIAQSYEDLFKLIKSGFPDKAQDLTIIDIASFILNASKYLQGYHGFLAKPGLKVGFITDKEYHKHKHKNVLLTLKNLVLSILQINPVTMKQLLREMSKQISLSAISCIICKDEKDQTDLDKAVIKTLDTFSMIDSGTPLHMAKSEISDSKTEMMNQQLLVNARLELKKKIDEFYNKRSGFAHSGVLNEGKDEASSIRLVDYQLALAILRMIMQKLLILHTNGKGMIYIRDRGDKGFRSLEEFINYIKYSGRIMIPGEDKD